MRLKTATMNPQGFMNDKFTIDELIKRSWNLRDSTAFINFFDFIAKFHHYSRFNTMLVYIQNEAVTFFGGVSYWKKKFNRKVKEDARPYVILAPMSPVMLVYDVFDTQGEDSPEEFLEKGLGRKPFEVRGNISPIVFDSAIEKAYLWGIPVNYKPLSYFNAGYITTVMRGKLEIFLKEGMSIEQNFTILLHELAHLLLGHTGHRVLMNLKSQKRFVLPEKRDLSRTAEELEAETVSYLISSKFGLETRSAEYIAGSIKDEKDLMRFSYETVIKVADKIENMFLKSFYTLRRNVDQFQQSLF